MATNQTPENGGAIDEQHVGVRQESQIDFLAQSRVGHRLEKVATIILDEFVRLSDEAKLLNPNVNDAEPNDEETLLFKDLSSNPEEYAGTMWGDFLLQEVAPNLNVESSRDSNLPTLKGFLRMGALSTDVVNLAREYAKAAEAQNSQKLNEIATILKGEMWKLQLMLSGGWRVSGFTLSVDAKDGKLAGEIMTSSLKKPQAEEMVEALKQLKSEMIITEVEKTAKIIGEASRYFMHHFFTENTWDFRQGATYGFVSSDLLNKESNKGNVPDEDEDKWEEMINSIHEEIGSEGVSYINEAYSIPDGLLGGANLYRTLFLGRAEKDEEKEELMDYFREDKNKILSFLEKWLDKALAIEIDVENFTYKIVDHPLDREEIINQWNKVAAAVFGENSPEMIME